MDLKLAGRRAVVIGGARGIGLAISEGFRAEGAHVALCARSSTEVGKAVQRLSAAGGGAEGAAIDVRDEKALAEWLARVAGGGGIDVAVLCASALAMGNAEADWRNSIEIDLLGSVRAITHLRPHLEQAAQRRGDAALVHISTTSVTETAFLAAYGAAKAAVVHYCKSVAKDLAPKKVRVNVVTPGTVYVEGGGWDKVKSVAPERFQAALARNPTGRMASPQEVADAVVFLASPRSSFTTGANLTVDGAITQAVHY